MGKGSGSIHPLAWNKSEPCPSVERLLSRTCFFSFGYKMAVVTLTSYADKKFSLKAKARKMAKKQTEKIVSNFLLM